MGVGVVVEQDRPAERARRQRRRPGSVALPASVTHLAHPEQGARRGRRDGRHRRRVVARLDLHASPAPRTRSGCRARAAWRCRCRRRVGVRDGERLVVGRLGRAVAEVPEVGERVAGVGIAAAGRVEGDGQRRRARERRCRSPPPSAALLPGRVVVDPAHLRRRSRRSCSRAPGCAPCGPKSRRRRCCRPGWWRSRPRCTAGPRPTAGRSSRRCSR